MKLIKILSTALTLFFYFNTAAQDEALKEQKVAVKIINSDARGVVMISGYFNEGITKVLLQQLTKEKIALIEKNYKEEDYPECIKKLVSHTTGDDAANNKIEAVFASLKTYRIATFDNIRNGENFGEESILVVPASENKNVRGNCNYSNDFYIIIPTKAIQVL